MGYRAFNSLLRKKAHAMFLFTFRFLNRKVALKMWKTPVEILKFFA